MTTSVFLMVLLGAALHAGWNVLVRLDLDRLSGLALVSSGWAALSVLMVPFVEFPTTSVWLWIAASLFIHTAYKLALAKAYELGDLGQVYPIARGAAPLLTAMATLIILNEPLSAVETTGIIILAAGLFFMALYGAKSLQLRMILAALATASFISLYTVVDGIGVRLAASSASYTAYLLILDGMAMLAALALMRGWVALRPLLPRWRLALIGGAMGHAAYWIPLWAMREAPIALVAALRETSVLFAVILGMLWLKEKLTPSRAIAAVLIVAGMIAIRWGG